MRHSHEVVYANLVATTETFAISLALFGREVRIAIFLAIIDVEATVVVEVLAGTLNAIEESLAVKRVKFIRRGVPGTIRGTPAPLRSAHQVRHGNVVTAAEALAVGRPHGRRNIGAAVLIAVVDVGAAMIAEVFAGAFNAVVEAAALNVVPGVGRALPVVTILSETRG